MGNLIRSLTVGSFVFISGQAYAGDSNFFDKVRGFFSSEMTSEEVILAYLEARQEEDFETVYSLLSSEDKREKTKDEFISSMKEGAMPRSLAKYNLIKIEEKGNTAIATIEGTHPNMLSIFETAMMSALAGDKKVLGEELKKKLERNELPMTTTKNTETLIKEEKGWKIYKNFKLARQKKEKSMAETTSKKKNKIKYIRKIKLYDFNAGRYTDISKESFTGIHFKLKNEGPRIIKGVEVTVYFMDKKKIIIYEKKLHPVSAKSWKRTDPLKPGYIWQLEKGHFMVVGGVPSEWEEGSALAKITDIEFAQN